MAGVLFRGSFILLAVLAWACGGGGDGGGADGGPSEDAPFRWDAARPGQDTSGPGTDGRSDLEPAGPNTPPFLIAPEPLELAQGASTTLDMKPLLKDTEDELDELVLSWSAPNVAMQDPGDHLLYIVAPTDWYGVEDIEITVTDTGGLTDNGVLRVVITEVTLPEPRPEDCGKVAFSLDAGTEAQQVLLSGTFNDWGSSPDAATVMTDPEADGVFAATLTLEPGSYQYRFIVDGVWMEDPENPNKVLNEYNEYNSVVVVPDCPGDGR